MITFMVGFLAWIMQVLGFSTQSSQKIAREEIQELYLKRRSLESKRKTYLSEIQQLQSLIRQKSGKEDFRAEVRRLRKHLTDLESSILNMKRSIEEIDAQIQSLQQQLEQQPA